MKWITIMKSRFKDWSEYNDKRAISTKYNDYGKR